MATQIKLRRDLAANWTSSNPILGSGEPGFETDTGKLKIGDGSTNWNALGYATPGTAGVYSNTMAAAYLTIYSGNISAGNITVTGTMNGTATSASTATYASTSGLATNATNVVGATQANITAVGTLTGLSSTGNITAQTANVYAGNVKANTAVYSAAYYWANGVAFASSSYSNTSAGYYLNSNLISSTISLTGNVIANAHYGNSYLYSNGTSILSGIGGTYSNSNVATYLTTYTGNLTAGNITSSNNVTAATINTTGNISGPNITLTNNISGNVAFFNSYQYANGVVWNGNLYTTSNVTATNSNVTQVGGTTNITYANTYNNATYTNSNVSSYLVTYTGNLTAGNINLTSNLTVGTGSTGLILRNLVNSGTQGALYSSYLTPTATNYVLKSGAGNNTYLNAPTGAGFVYLGAGDTQTVAVSTGTAGTTYNVQSLLVSSGGMGVTGDSAFTANVGIVGNLSAGNISTNGAFSAVSAAITANTTVGNINATGNAAATYFVGNGSLLTGIISVSSYTNTNVQSYLPIYSGAIGNITGNITAAGGGVLEGYISGAIGANGANTGAFTTVSATGTITAAYFAPTSGGQFLGYVTGAIGANVPNTGAFTTVTTSGAVTAATSITAGTQVIGYLTGAIGANTANTGAFTTVTTTGGYINGAIGANTPNSVVATSVTTSAGGQLIGYMTGALGANTPNSVVATSVTTSAGGQHIGYFTGAIGANSANTAAFTTMSTTGNATIGANIFSSANVTYDLGTNSNRFRTLYAGSVDLNGAVLTGSANGLQTGAINNTIIGNVTASAGTFTTITAQNGVVATGGQITGYHTGAIGANTANSGTFTTASITNSTNTTGLGTGALIVTNGGASIQQDLYVGGNLIVANVISQSSQTLVVRDPLLYLSANNGAYNYSIGMYSNFIGGNVTQYAHTGLVRNYVDNQWYLFSNVPEPTGGVVNMSSAGIVYDTLKAGGVILANTTASTNTTSGALQVAGGAGIAGALYAGSIQNTPIGSTTASTGAFTTVTTSSTITSQGTISAPTVQAGTIGNSGATLTGTLSTAAQTNVTSLGTLTGLAMSGAIVPNANNFVALGSASAYWSTIYGVSFVGTSTTAKYADLAERYLADQYYAPGTVVVFGGSKEITTSEISHDRTVAGVISTNPAYLMNDNDELNMLAVALQGRVPCAVMGPVVKGQLLVTSGIPGVAQALNDDMWKPGCVIGKSLVDHTDATVEVIEIAVGRD